MFTGGVCGGACCATSTFGASGRFGAGAGWAFFSMVGGGASLFTGAAALVTGDGGGVAGARRLGRGAADSTLNSLFTFPRFGAVCVTSVSGAIRGVMCLAMAWVTGAVTLFGR